MREPLQAVFGHRHMRFGGSTDPLQHIVDEHRPHHLAIAARRDRRESDPARRLRQQKVADRNPIRLTVGIAAGRPSRHVDRRAIDDRQRIDVARRRAGPDQRPFLAAAGLLPTDGRQAGADRAFRRVIIADRAAGQERGRRTLTALRLHLNIVEPVIGRVAQVHPADIQRQVAKGDVRGAQVDRARPCFHDAVCARVGVLGIAHDDRPAFGRREAGGYRRRAHAGRSGRDDDNGIVGHAADRRAAIGRRRRSVGEVDRLERACDADRLAGRRNRLGCRERRLHHRRRCGGGAVHRIAHHIGRRIAGARRVIGHDQRRVGRVDEAARIRRLHRSRCPRRADPGIERLVNGDETGIQPARVDIRAPAAHGVAMGVAGRHRACPDAFRRGAVGHVEAHGRQPAAPLRVDRPRHDIDPERSGDTLLGHGQPASADYRRSGQGAVVGDGDAGLRRRTAAPSGGQRQGATIAGIDMGRQAQSHSAGAIAIIDLVQQLGVGDCRAAGRDRRFSTGLDRPKRPRPRRIGHRLPTRPVETGGRGGQGDAGHRHGVVGKAIACPTARTHPRKGERQDRAAAVDRGGGDGAGRGRRWRRRAIVHPGRARLGWKAHHIADHHA